MAGYDRGVAPCAGVVGRAGRVLRAEGGPAGEPRGAPACGRIRDVRAMVRREAGVFLQLRFFRRARTWTGMAGPALCLRRDRHGLNPAWLRFRDGIGQDGIRVTLERVRRYVIAPLPTTASVR